MAWRIPLPSCSADSHLAQTAACTTPGAADCGSDGCCATQMRPPRPQPDDVCCSRPPLLLDLAADPAVRDLIKPYGSYGNTNLNAVKQALSRLGYDTAANPQSVAAAVRRIVKRVFDAVPPPVDAPSLPLAAQLDTSSPRTAWHPGGGTGCSQDNRPARGSAIVSSAGSAASGRLTVHIAADPEVRDLIKPFRSFATANLNVVKAGLSCLGYDTAGKPDSVDRALKWVP